MREENNYRPITNFAKAYCFNCTVARWFQLNSNGYSSEPEFQCQKCGHKTNALTDREFTLIEEQ